MGGVHCDCAESMVAGVHEIYKNTSMVVGSDREKKAMFIHHHDRIFGSIVIFCHKIGYIKTEKSIKNNENIS